MLDFRQVGRGSFIKSPTIGLTVLGLGDALIDKWNAKLLST